MQYYRVKIRLAGNTANEVNKVVSSPELLILQYVHGVDAITSVEKSKRENINLMDEKSRLKGLYDRALVKRKQSIDTIFGPLGSVPEELPPTLLEQFNIVDEDDIIKAAKTITKKDKKANHSQTMRSQKELDNSKKIVEREDISLEEIAG